jgi:hypothetical protein
MVEKMKIDEQKVFDKLQDDYDKVVAENQKLREERNKLSFELSDKIGENFELDARMAKMKELSIPGLILSVLICIVCTGGALHALVKDYNLGVVISVSWTAWFVSVMVYWAVWMWGWRKQ